MKRFAFLIFALSASITAFGHFANVHEPTRATAQEQPKSVDVRFPTVPVEVVPTPKPAPNAVMKLAMDEWYIIDADVPILLFDSPVGMVKVTKESGPLTLRGRFVGEVGVKTKKVKGKYIYQVEAAKTGAVELIVVPVGATDEASAIRKTLDVDAGEGPRPPPEPTDTAFPMDGKFRVLIIEETADRANNKYTPGQVAAIQGVPVRNYLEAKCNPGVGKKDFYIVDKDTDMTPAGVMWTRAMDFARKGPIPGIIVSNGKTEYRGELPKDDALPLLKKLGGE